MGIRLTVPKQAQGLKGMMARYNVGIAPRGYEAIYSEDPTLDVGINPLRLDYVDIDRLKDENLAEINHLNAKRERALQKAQEAAKEQQEKEFEDKLRAKIKAEEAGTP